MLKPERVKLVVYGDGEWEQVIDLDTGKTLIEGHKLCAEDVLFGLGYRFEIEHVFEAEE